MQIVACKDEEIEGIVKSVMNRCPTCKGYGTIEMVLGHGECRVCKSVYTSEIYFPRYSRLIKDKIKEALNNSIYLGS